MPYPFGQLAPHVVEAPPTPPRVFLREPPPRPPVESPKAVAQRRRTERGLKLNDGAES